MKHWTLSQRITLGFAAVLGLLCMIGGAGWLGLARIETSVRKITDDGLPGLERSAQILDGALEYRVITLKHVIADTDSERADLAKQADEKALVVARLIAEYGKTLSSTADRTLFAKIEPALNAYREEAKKVRESSAKGDSEGASRIMHSSAAATWNEFDQAVTALCEWNVEHAEKASQDITVTLRNTRVATITLVTLAILTGLGLSWGISRATSRLLARLAHALDDGSQQVAAAAGQVASASQTLAEGASEQAASLEETSASLEEMSSMTKRNTESSERVNTLAREARSAADLGAREMETMNAAMNEIRTSSDDIAKIIRTIDEIAFQTNILALNAAVEAARAGEAGMGFAVVADEVRSLAQRAANSAKETSTQIENAVGKTALGVQTSARVTTHLQEILGKIRQVDELASEVASASREQSQGIQQVNTAVTQMDKVTQSNAASAEESASASEELNAQAAALKDVVAELQAFVGRRRALPSPVEDEPNHRPTSLAGKLRPSSRPARSLQPPARVATLGSSLPANGPIAKG